MKKGAKKVVEERAVLVGNEKYGLYIGYTTAADETVLKKRAIRLRDCRHVYYWVGKTGGVTSLAKHGPCGPNALSSRVGAPCDSALLTGVVNVFDLSPEAVDNFAKIVPE